MPNNTKPMGIRVPAIIRNPFGIWIRNKFAGMHLGKNTRASDYAHLDLIPPKGHTSPVVRTSQNDGHANPTRIKHAKTKARHRLNYPCISMELKNA